MNDKTPEMLPPWKNSDGSKKTDAEISLLGQSWDLATWKKFLDEDVGSVVPSKRLSFRPYMDIAGNATGEEGSSLSRKFQGIDLATVISTALGELADRERRILEGYFWKKSDTRKIAERENLSPGNVRKIKSRSLKKLGKILASNNFKIKLDRALKRKREKIQDYYRESGLKNQVLGFIRENFHRFGTDEGKVADGLYFKQMTLPMIATALGKTVGEVKAIRSSAFTKLEKVYFGGYIENKNKTLRRVAQ